MVHDTVPLTQCSFINLEWHRLELSCEYVGDQKTSHVEIKIAKCENATSSIQWL